MASSAGNIATPTAARGIRLCLVAVAVSASQFGLTTLGPLQETIRATLLLNDNEIAILQGPTRALPMILGAIPLGLLVDRSSRVRLLAIFAILNICGNVGTAVASSFSALLLARCLVGLSSAAILTAAISLVADLYPPGQRGRATMMIGIGQVVGASAAFALGGQLIDAFALEESGWRCATLWMTCPLVAVLLVNVALKEPPRIGIGIAKLTFRWSFVGLWSYRAVLVPLLGGVVIVDVAFGGAYIWATPVFTRRFGLSPKNVGSIMAGVLLIGGIVGPVAGGVLADVCQRVGGPRKTVGALIVLTLVSVPTGFFAIAPTVGWASTLLLLFLILVPTISLMVTTLCTVLVPNELRGLCTAVLNALSVSFAYFVAPLAVSSLSTVLGGPTMIGPAVTWVCVIASLIGSAIFVFGRQNFPRVIAQ